MNDKSKSESSVSSGRIEELRIKLDFIARLAVPLVIVVALFLYKGTFDELIGRTHKARILGNEVEFRESVQQSEEARRSSQEELASLQKSLAKAMEELSKAKEDTKYVAEITKLLETSAKQVERAQTGLAVSSIRNEPLLQGRMGDKGINEDGWFAVVASLPGNFTEQQVSEVAANLSRKAKEAGIMESICVYKTVISQNFAITLGGPSSESTARNFAKLARTKGTNVVARDAFHQIDRSWRSRNELSPEPARCDA